MLMFLTACESTKDVSSGAVVYVSEGVQMWGQIPEEELNRPLGEYQGKDILTPETAKGILLNNERLK